MKCIFQEKWKVCLMQNSIKWNLGLSTVHILHSAVEIVLNSRLVGSVYELKYGAGLELCLLLLLILISLKCCHSSHALLKMEYAEYMKIHPCPVCTSLCYVFLCYDFRILASVSSLHKRKIFLKGFPQTVLGISKNFFSSQGDPSIKLQICILVFIRYFSFLLRYDFTRTDAKYFWEGFVFCFIGAFITQKCGDFK